MSPVWQKAYPPGVHWDTPLAISTVTEEFATAVKRFGKRPAVEFMGLTLDYQTLDFVIGQVACGLEALGVRKGTHVALHLPNTPHYPICFFAVLRAGGVVVNLSPLDAERELAHKLDKADVAVVIGFAGLADKLPKPGPDLRLVLCTPEDMRIQGATIPADPTLPVPFAALLDPTRQHEGPWPEAVPEAIALLQFTGGTTGLPKAAVLTHGNLMAAVSIYDHWSTPFGILPGEERTLLVLPLFHIYALAAVFLRGVRNGALMLLKARWNVDDIIQAIEVQKPTLFPGVPTMFRALASHKDARPEIFASLKVCNCGGAPLPVELQQEFERVAGKQVYEGWGMTETSPAGTGTPIGGGKPGSAGVPLPGITIEIRELDDPTRRCAPGEKGEICIGGPNVMSGYYKVDSAPFFVDGLFRTGDAGYLDEDGYLFIVDRVKDMILSGGYNVYPRAIEEAICEHPSVAEVIVIGVPDAYRGEAAKAFITLRAGAVPFSIDDLRAFLEDKLGRHELPAAVEFRDVLPKTAVGKLWKKPLIDEERARMAG
jgi:long-chain acyl-CoA synthetase